MPSFEEQMAFFEIIEPNLTGQELDAVLSGGTGFQNGKQRVSQYFSEEHTEKEKAKFLAKEYGTGGQSWTFQDGTNGFLWHDSKGISASRAGLDFNAPEIHISWAKAANRVAELIASDQYLTEKEKA
ncbi:hypothetical protein D7X33_48735, partial [Butyricicoccus sp. 1XD8-22]